MRRLPVLVLVAVTALIGPHPASTRPVAEPIPDPGDPSATCWPVAGNVAFVADTASAFHAVRCTQPVVWIYVEGWLTRDNQLQGGHDRAVCQYKAACSLYSSEYPAQRGWWHAWTTGAYSVDGQVAWNFGYAWRSTDCMFKFCAATPPPRPGRVGGSGPIRTVDPS